MKGTFCSRAEYVAECEMENGHVLLLPMARVRLGDDLTDHQVVLEDPLYIEVWRLLRQGCSVADLKRELPGDLEQDTVEQILNDFFDHGLAEVCIAASAPG